jgi:hypothetical protein
LLLFSSESSIFPLADEIGRDGNRFIENIFLSVFSIAVEIGKTVKLFEIKVGEENGTKRVSVIGGWRKLLNEEHFKIIGMNKW